MQMKPLSETLAAQGGCCGDGHDHAHDHVHPTFDLGWAIFGGILVLNSVLAERLFYTGEPIIATISAVAGALVLALPIWLTAAKDVAAGRTNMNELVALALLAAFADGKYLEAGIIAFFMLLAILIEQKTAIGATRSIEALIRLAPATAHRVTGEDGHEEEVRALDLQIGNVVRVRPGENFAVDGVIVKGESTVNQAPITGESLPVDKVVGSEVYAGTENITGSVDLRVTKVGKDTTLGRVRDLIEAAEGTRLPVMRLVDRYVGYYTPTILMIGAIVWFFKGELGAVVFILVISCPCALVLATPSAVIAAIASAARLGVLIKNVAHIETAAQINAVVFDKTGTLTEGHLEVARLRPAPGVELADLLRVAVSAESRSNHPAAMAMRRLAGEAKVKWQDPVEFREIVGKGVLARFADGEYRVGRESWMKELGLETAGFHNPDDERDLGDAHRMSIIYIARDNQILGWIGLQDAIREAAQPAVTELGQLGVRRCCLVTGDNETVAKAVARKVGIHEIQAECLPQQKVEFVNRVRAEGASVAVVGDGVNDAPALAAGDIGIAMGAIGSDVAVNSASIALMNNDLRRVPFLIRLSRKARTIIHQNLAFGALVIVGGMMLFIFGDEWLNRVAASTKLMDKSVLKAVLASSMHVASTLIVLFNSARLVRFGEELELAPTAPPQSPAEAPEKAATNPATATV